MLYHLEDGSDDQPTLAEMTEVAIKILSKENNGFYLFVEGGKIDIAHHSQYTRRSLDETVQFQNAIQVGTISSACILIQQILSKYYLILVNNNCIGSYRSSTETYSIVMKWNIEPCLF